MNKKFIKAFSITAIAAVGIAMCFVPKSFYVPRTSSNIDADALKFEDEESEGVEGMISYVNAIRANRTTGTVSVEEFERALQAADQLSAKRSVNSVWKNLGPDNVGGRARAFLQDVDTPGIMYVAGVSGGLFRSTSRGSSWKPVNDFQENLNIVSIAQNKDRVIVYGTGEGRFVAITGTEIGTPGFSGAGMFRSTNSGYSFTKVNHPSWGNVSSLAAEPRSVGARFFAATDNGVKWSDDGLNWNNAKSGASLEVKVAPNGDVYAQIGAKIFKSTDRGVNWSDVTPPGANITRASIAISPQDKNYVYVMASSGGTLDGVFSSTDAGATWTKIITGSLNFFDPLASVESAQGTYNNVLSVDPRNRDRIFMGGVTLAQWVRGNNPQIIASTNDFGGNRQYVHADKHIMQWDMSTNPPTFIVGSDGGLAFSSDNLATFTQKNFGFTTFQAYAVAADYEGNVAGGAQDNGTQYINKKGNTEKSSVLIKGGDGFQCEISTKQNNIIFSESQYGNMTRSRDYGKSQACVWDRRIARCFIGLTDTNKYCDQNHKSTWAPFNTMFKLWEHPEPDSTQSRLFLARNGQIWMMEDATNLDVNPTWYLIANGVGNDVWDIEVTPDGNSVFIGSNGAVQRIDGLNSATYYKWSNPLSIPPGISISNLNINSGGRAVTSVNLNPNNVNEALITIGNYGGASYVFKGANMLGSATFTDITNNLPLMPVYDGLITYNSSNIMYLATDLGVYASDNGGASWTAQTNATNKFPKVSTFAIRQYYFPGRNKGIIYAGTHGRGFFECADYKTNIKTASMESKASFAISAYPNPANDYVNLKFNLTQEEKITCSVIDVTGKVVKVILLGTLSKGENNVNIETKAFQSGVYFVNVSGTKPKGTVKLILTH